MYMIIIKKKLSFFIYAYDGEGERMNYLERENGVSDREFGTGREGNWSFGRGIELKGEEEWWECGVVTRGKETNCNSLFIFPQPKILVLFNII